LELEFKKEVKDERGKIIFLQYGKRQINIVEIKKGYSRGGHYHKSSTKHILITGKVKCQEKQIDTDDEKITVVKAPNTITISKDTPHMLTALKDTVFLESFSDGYEDSIYPEYRKIVMEKIRKRSKNLVV
jgi:dTDP-4-dehydrorhamnose 3,5-epimerase-like enzyme